MQRTWFCLVCHWGTGRDGVSVWRRLACNLRWLIWGDVQPASLDSTESKVGSSVGRFREYARRAWSHPPVWLGAYWQTPAQQASEHGVVLLTTMKGACHQCVGSVPLAVCLPALRGRMSNHRIQFVISAVRRRQSRMPAIQAGLRHMEASTADSHTTMFRALETLCRSRQHSGVTHSAWLDALHARFTATSVVVSCAWDEERAHWMINTLTKFGCWCLEARGYQL